ncbi:Uncharacterised protein [uncultured archaeon]|nr:Uncharacterised protein [uncultured archaeon]
MNVGVRQLAFKEKESPAQERMQQKQVPLAAEISLRERFIVALRCWEHANHCPAIPKATKRQFFSDYAVLAEQIIKLNNPPRMLAA